MKSEQGSISTYILLVFTVVVATALGYILLSKPGADKNVSAMGTAAVRMPSKQQIIKPSVPFTDGLNHPHSSETRALDETGAGVANKETFNVDINKDGLVDTIVRTHHENGTSHFWYEYRIELNNNGVFFNIAPDGLRTTEGAECALQKIQFVFNPTFKVIKISRPWDETWDTPTMATRTVYELQDNKMVETSVKKLKTICDVSELFTEI